MAQRTYIPSINYVPDVGSHPRPPPQIYIVVQVHSGISTIAEAYSDETAAIDRAEELKADINPEYDEIDVFSTPLK